MVLLGLRDVAAMPQRYLLPIWPLMGLAPALGRVCRGGTRRQAARRAAGTRTRLAAAGAVVALALAANAAPWRATSPCTPTTGEPTSSCSASATARWRA